MGKSIDTSIVEIEISKELHKRLLAHCRIYKCSERAAVIWCMDRGMSICEDTAKIFAERG